MTKYHLTIVHFPIALIICTFIYGIVGLLYKREFIKEVVFWNLIMGTIAAGFAMYTGFENENSIQDHQLKEILLLHQRNAYFLMSLLALLVIWMGFRKKWMDRMEYAAWLSLFFLACSSITYQSYIGHEMAMKHSEQLMILKAAKEKPIKKELDYEKYF